MRAGQVDRRRVFRWTDAHRARRPPIPGGRVILTLADGKKLTLPQTLSGSGIRYANEGETFVFWSKGDTAFVEEGANQTMTYKDCVGRKK